MLMLMMTCCRQLSFIIVVFIAIALSFVAACVVDVGSGACLYFLLVLLSLSL